MKKRWEKSRIHFMSAYYGEDENSCSELYQEEDYSINLK
jgi:hypothetical protein